MPGIVSFFSAAMSGGNASISPDVFALNTTNTTGDNVTDAIEHALEQQKHDESTTHALFVRAVVMLALIVICMHINAFLKSRHFHYLSESAVTILVGLFVATAWTTIANEEHNNTIQLSSKFFYMVLLPPIIFEGGYTLKRTAFFKNLLSILLIAFIGAFYSTFVTSVLMYFFSKLIFPLSFVESLVFGSLISSTDPVTVLSLLPSTVDQRLYLLIFGESALNDAVAIILYRFFTELADPKMRLGAAPFFISVIASAGVFVGSFLVGIVMGMLFAWITKNFKTHEKHEQGLYEMTMFLVFAYSSYLLGDVLELTGIISVFFAGISMAHYAHNNLEEASRKNLKTTLRTLSFMCETFIFLYLGLGLLSFEGKTVYSPMMVVFASITILISRTHVFVLLGIRNLIKRREPAEQIPINHQILIWFSGLRGAVAFALGVTFLEHPVFDQNVKGVIFGTTVMVVVLTVLVLGGLTPYMLKWLKIVKDEDESAAKPAEHQEPAQINNNAAGADGKGLVHDAPVNGQGYSVVTTGDEEEIVRPGETMKPVFGWLYNLDRRYIRPYLSAKSVTNLADLAKEDTEHSAPQAEEASSAVKLVPPSKKEKDVEDPFNDRIGLIKSAKSDDHMNDIELSTIDLQKN